MLGDRERFSPEAFLRENYADVRIVERSLPTGVQGCIDLDRRIIWLDDRLTPVERRSVLAFEVAQLMCPVPSDACMAAAHRRATEDWAALMLVPSDMFAAAWGDCLDLSAMAAFCEVDLATFRARIRAASDADQDAAVEAITRTRLSA